ncbi:hypothetical protein LINPERHAP2_LOCUS36920 [Linum perenne]
MLENIAKSRLIAI